MWRFSRRAEFRAFCRRDVILDVPHRNEPCCVPCWVFVCLYCIWVCVCVCVCVCVRESERERERERGVIEAWFGQQSTSLGKCAMYEDENRQPKMTYTIKHTHTHTHTQTNTHTGHEVIIFKLLDSFTSDAGQNKRGADDKGWLQHSAGEESKGNSWRHEAKNTEKMKPVWPEEHKWTPSFPVRSYQSSQAKYFSKLPEMSLWF